MLIEQKEEAYKARMKALDDKIKSLEEEAEKYGKRHEEKIKAIQEENAIREAEDKRIRKNMIRGNNLDLISQPG